MPSRVVLCLLAVVAASPAGGQRNETRRGRLETIEFSFRGIEAIRTQFHDALTSIDQTLVEIERTKVANLEAERRWRT